MFRALLLLLLVSCSAPSGGGERVIVRLKNSTTSTIYITHTYNGSDRVITVPPGQTWVKIMGKDALAGLEAFGVEIEGEK